MMAKALIIKNGQVFNRLTVLKEVEKRAGKRYFECICECGNHGEYRLVAMRAGKIKSCGCLRNKQNKTVGITHGKRNTRIYTIWHSMKQRCLNLNNINYRHYGGRGIEICNEWRDSFELFYDWAVKNGYSKNLTIDRIEVDRNYEPSNCRFISMKDQNRNKKNNVFIEFNGENLCVIDWAKKLDISNSAMQKRLKNWTLEKALTEPKNYKHAT